jgi:hypothetical protein
MPISNKYLINVMNTKKSLALVSTSTLAAGMAQGAVIYSGSLNLVQTLGVDDPNVRQSVNMLGGPNPDFTFGYEFGTSWNGVLVPVVEKPYVDVRTNVSTAIPVQSGMLSVLGKANTGLPVTGPGTMIDAGYAATYPLLTGGRGYMNQDGGSGTVIGDWSGTAITDAYVGIEVNPGDGNHYGWLHFIDNPTLDTHSLTLVDWAYESAVGVGISTSAVPEPSSLALGGVGIAALLMLRKRERLV